MTSQRIFRITGIALLSLVPLQNNASASPGTVALTQAAALEEQSRVWEQATQIRAEQPELAERVDASTPSRSRTGSLVFTPSEVNQPEAATLLIARSGRSEDPSFRRAVAEALPQTKSDKLGALIASELALETSAQVRVSLTHALRYAKDAPAEPALVRALQDEDPQVRETALTSIRAHQNAAHFGAAILRAVQDPNPRVQAAALRAWGSLRNPALAVDVERALQSESGKVRLAALRGQWRVDRTKARALAADLELDQDADPKVARLASRILAN